MTELTEGWVWLVNSTKWHYMRNGQSLCRRWGYFGSTYEQGNDNSSDNCKTCQRALAKEKAEA